MTGRPIAPWNLGPSLEKAKLDGSPRQHFLLAHRPENLEEVPEHEAGISLQLTHGHAAWRPVLAVDLRCEACAPRVCPQPQPLWQDARVHKHRGGNVGSAFPARDALGGCAHPSRIGLAAYSLRSPNSLAANCCRIAKTSCIRKNPAKKDRQPTPRERDDH